MVRYTNECCGCAVPAYPCIGDICPNRIVPHHYCDNCGDETELYILDGQELCIECVKEVLDKIGD